MRPKVRCISTEASTALRKDPTIISKLVQGRGVRFCDPVRRHPAKTRRRRASPSHIGKEAAMPDFKVNPQPWMKAAVNVADDALVKALVDDFRSYNPAPRSTLSPPATVRVVGAGNV